MDRVTFSALLDSIQQDERQVRDQGQAEYAHDDDNCFANFEAAALELGGTREEDLMHLALKHWRGICAYVKGHTSQREDVRGRIKDLRMYLALLWAMVEEREAKVDKILGLDKGRQTIIDESIRRVSDRLDDDAVNNPRYYGALSDYPAVSACCGCSCGRCTLGHDTGPYEHTKECSERFFDAIDKAAQDEESLIACKNCEGPIEQDEYERSGLCSRCEQTMNRDIDSMLTEVDA